jgi:hypothetical protein
MTQEFRYSLVGVFIEIARLMNSINELPAKSKYSPRSSLLLSLSLTRKAVNIPLTIIAIHLLSFSLAASPPPTNNKETFSPFPPLIRTRRGAKIPLSLHILLYIKSKHATIASSISTSFNIQHLCGCFHSREPRERRGERERRNTGKIKWKQKVSRRMRKRSSLRDCF